MHNPGKQIPSEFIRAHPMLRTRRHQTFLHIRSCPHLLGAAHQHPYLTGTHFGEQLLLFDLGVRVMDEGDFFFWNACRDQLPADVLIDGKSLAARRGEVRKDELGQLAAFALPPDAQDVFHALIDLAVLVVWQERIEDALVQPQLPAVRGVG